jgi:hypothetical protein
MHRNGEYQKNFRMSQPQSQDVADPHARYLPRISGALKDDHSARIYGPVSTLFHSDPMLSRRFPEKHNAAPAEYVRWAALVIHWALKSPAGICQQ